MKSTEQDNFGWRKKAEMNEYFKPISFKLLLSGLYKNCSRSIFHWRYTFKNTLSGLFHQYYPKKWDRIFRYPLTLLCICTLYFKLGVLPLLWRFLVVQPMCNPWQMSAKNFPERFLKYSHFLLSWSTGHWIFPFFGQSTLFCL